MPTPPPGSCAPADALSALARGDRDGAGPWAAHVDDCPVCRDQVAALLDRTAPVDLPPTDSFDLRTGGDRDADLAPAGSDVRAEAARFLRPPEGPDELGRLGPYRVLGVLGAGGMGLVLRADDPGLGRPVALKVLRAHLAADPAAQVRFRREAQAMAAVEHDHVVPVHAVGSDNGVPFVAMPLLEGETLSAAIRRDGRLAPARVVELGRQVAAGLAAAHARGLVHRDVTPANIWVEPRPDGAERARLLDFGLARAVAGTPTDVTRTGAVIGTPAYMSPEQARGRPTDFRTDLFSLGVVLYRAATGEAPFRGEDSFAVARQIVETDPPAPARVVPDLPPGLSALVMRLLQKDPAARPASAQDVAEELARIAAGKPRPRAGPRRLGAPVLVGAMVLIALVVALAWPHGESGPGDPPPPPDRLTRVRTAGADQDHTQVYALGLARGEGGLVVLSEGFPNAGAGRGVHLWTADLEPLGVLPTRGDYIRALAPTPDGRRFVTVGGGGLEVWALAGRSIQRVIPAAAPPAAIAGIVVAPSGERVYTTDYEEAGVVRAYHLTSTALNPVTTLPGVLGRPRSLAVSGDGLWVGATAKTGKVVLWDLRPANGPVAHVLRPAGRPIAVVAFSSDGRRAWVVDGTAAGEAFDLSGEKPVRAGAVPTELGQGTTALAVFPAADGTRLIAVSDRAVQLLDVTVDPARSLGTEEVPSPIRGAAFYPSGRLYTGHEDGLRQWQLAGP